MSLIINLCYDTLVSDDVGYPNLAHENLSESQLDQTWPKTVALRLLSYLPLGGFRAHVWSVESAPTGSWYPVGLSWFDFSCDYFELMRQDLKTRLRRGELGVLFYYHEGDNPQRIKQRLDICCQQHDLPLDCYVFISANSAASPLPRFYYFADHEFFFRRINRYQSAPKPVAHVRPFQFTLLNRTHKWWRATVMADLQRHGMLAHALWSYNTHCTIDDDWKDNPLRLDVIDIDPEQVSQFLANGPYFADEADSSMQNDHSQVNIDLYQKSYVQVVLETHLDVDQSRGVFLTEKTYKCLKFGQPFVLLGAAGSIQQLRDQGYCVYDDVIDHGYDLLADTTQRYVAARESLKNLASRNLAALLEEITPAVEKNQNHFLERGPDDLYQLLCWLDQLKTGT